MSAAQFAAARNALANAIADVLVGPGQWMPLSLRYRLAGRALEALAAVDPTPIEIDAAHRAWVESLTGRALTDDEWAALGSSTERAAMKAALTAARVCFRSAAEWYELPPWLTPEAREHWEQCKTRRAKYGDGDCQCALCQSLQNFLGRAS